MIGTPVVLELACVVFNAANVNFCTLSEPVFGNTEQESLLDCLCALSAEVVANKKMHKAVVAKVDRASMTVSSRR